MCSSSSYRCSSSATRCPASAATTGAAVASDGAGRAQAAPGPAAPPDVAVLRLAGAVGQDVDVDVLVDAGAVAVFADPADLLQATGGRLAEALPGSPG
jgi:hypothetical protein